jgi:hypothetical protein
MIDGTGLSHSAYPVACGAERHLARFPAREFLVGGGSVCARPRGRHRA